MRIPKLSRVAALLRPLKKRRFAAPMAVVLVLLTFYGCTINHNEPNEVGIARNLISGDMQLQDGGGFFLSAPWVWVARVNTSPMRVGVTSAGHGYSAKLVQFDKTHWREFVEVEGWHYYWLANRISFNLGYDEEYRGMRDIMRGYAYSAKQCPFLVVLQEYQSK